MKLEEHDKIKQGQNTIRKALHEPPSRGRGFGYWFARCVKPRPGPKQFTTSDHSYGGASIPGRVLRPERTFAVAATGVGPLGYQWQLDGRPLPGKTNQTLVVSPAQPGDEGDYTVVVTNTFGAVTNNPPARLYVIPTNQFVKANSTNQLGLRLPYFYELPTNYDSAHSYPLVCYFHGSPNDETTWPTYLSSYALFHVLSSFRGQATDPTIVVWPTRRAGDSSSWTDQYLRQVTNLLDAAGGEVQISTRIASASEAAPEGGHAAWDTLD